MDDFDIVFVQGSQLARLKSKHMFFSLNVPAALPCVFGFCRALIDIIVLNGLLCVLDASKLKRRQIGHRANQHAVTTRTHIGWHNRENLSFDSYLEMFVRSRIWDARTPSMNS